MSKKGGHFLASRGKHWQQHTIARNRVSIYLTYCFREKFSFKLGMWESVGVCMWSHQSQAAWTFFPPVETRAFKLQRRKAETAIKQKINSFSSRLCSLGGDGSTSTWQRTKTETSPGWCRKALGLAARVQYWHETWKTHHRYRFHVHGQYLSLARCCSWDSPLCVRWHRQTLFTIMTQAWFYLCHFIKCISEPDSAGCMKVLRCSESN